MTTGLRIANLSIVATACLSGRMLAFAAVALCLAGCGSGNSPTDPPGANAETEKDPAAAVLPVRIQKVAKGRVARYLESSGIVEAEHRSDVYPKTQGLVRAVFFQEGDDVKPGAVLAELEDEELVLAFRKAAVAKEKAKNEYDRQRQQLEGQATNVGQVERARAELETAELEYESAKLTLEYARIVAPIGGVLTHRNLEVGTRVGPTERAFSIADRERLLTRVFVPEKDVLSLQPGLPCKILIEALGAKVLGGSVERVSPVIDSSSGTVKVTVRLGPDAAGVPPGVLAMVRIVVEEHEGVTVLPKRAIVYESQQPVAFVATEGKAEKRTLSLGIADREEVEVLEGLKPGEDLIIVGQTLLRGGESVRASEDNSATPATEPATPD